jgi:FAD/FMN-containing dehydrogenase
VTTKAGRYVQGGGCGTVGVAGLVQGGGFGSFSKNFGTAAASLLEAEIVTADGEIRLANACTHPDLFWALRGGGGGTFGVVTRLTLGTHSLPTFFGGVFALRLSAGAKSCCNSGAPSVDPAFLKAHVPGAVLADDRPGAPEDNVFWSANLAEAGHFLAGFQSLWLPRSLLQPDRRQQFAQALFSASRDWPVELHFQKGLAGGSETAASATAETATNPDVLGAFALAIIAGESPPAFPGLRGHAPDLGAARRDAAAIGRAMAELKAVAPEGGCYVAESDFFEPQWQKSYWGANYPRLLSIKSKYDPSGLFFVHHGVGSEGWSEDGFTRRPKR